jgi:hypothetical protein
MRLVLAAIGLGTLLGLGAAQACAPGRYAGAAAPKDRPPFPVLITIRCEAGGPVGEVESPFGTHPIAAARMDTDALHVEADMGGPRLVLDARRSGEQWSGTFAAGPRRGTIRLARDDNATLSTAMVELPPRTELTAAEWAQDLGFIEGEIPLRHAHAFHRMTRAEWHAAVDQLRRRLPSLASSEVPVALRQLVARIGDAHTSLSLPPGVERLPLGFWWFGDELRIVRAGAAYKHILGARLLAVGGVPIADAHARVATLVPAENAWAVHAFPPYFLVRRDVLTHFALARPGAAASLDLQLMDGTRHSADVAFAPRLAEGEWRHVGGRPPTWQASPDQPLSWRRLDGGLLYVNFRGYESLRQRGPELLAEIDREPPTKLVLDLRDNGGGDFNLFRRVLLDAIIDRPWLNRHDRLFVLIGRETFSAAMTNAADLKLRTRATLVGEPVGERPNSYQELATLTLPNSRLRLGVSTRWYEALPGQGDPDALEPHVFCPPTWANFARARDDAIACVREGRTP